MHLSKCLSAEETEPDHYSKLQNPQEDVYAEAFYCDASASKKPGTLWRPMDLFVCSCCLVRSVCSQHVGMMHPCRRHFISFSVFQGIQN